MTRDESEKIGHLIASVEDINKRLDKQNGYIGDMARALALHTTEQAGAAIRVLETALEQQKIDTRTKATDKITIRAAWITAGVSIGLFIWQLLR